MFCSDAVAPISRCVRNPSLLWGLLLPSEGTKPYHFMSQLNCWDEWCIETTQSSEIFQHKQTNWCVQGRGGIYPNSLKDNFFPNTEKTLNVDHSWGTASSVTQTMIFEPSNAWTATELLLFSQQVNSSQTTSALSLETGILNNGLILIWQKQSVGEI